MALPVRIPDPGDFNRRRLPAPVPVNKRMIQAEQRAQQEIFLHHLQQEKDIIKADIEMAANHEIISKVFDIESDFFDEKLERAGTSQVKQHNLADRLALLTALNDGTIARFRR